MNFQKGMSDMQKLEALVHERTIELLLYRAFVKDKGLEAEFKKLLAKAKEKSNAAD